MIEFPIFSRYELQRIFIFLSKMCCHLINIIHEHIDILKNRAVDSLKHIFGLFKTIYKHLVSIINQTLTHRLYIRYLFIDFKL